MKTMRPKHEHGEIPPTAGLPLRLADLWPGGKADLAASLSGLTHRADALLTCSGTAALVIALTTLARRSDRREVVVPAYTCPLVAMAIRHCGLVVRLCDTRRHHFEMDPVALAAAVGQHTLAVVPAHLGGRLADTATVMRIAHASGAMVIEDAAQALGARHADNAPAAALGDIGLYSLAVGKGLSIYEGGLLVAAAPDLHAEIGRCEDTMIATSPAWELRRSIELLAYWALYRPMGLRLAYGMPRRRALRRGDAIGAVGDRFGARIPLHRPGRWRQSVGAHAAARLPAWLEQTRRQALHRIALLRELPGVTVLEDRPGEHGTWPFFVLLMPSQACRDRALQHLWASTLGVSRLFIHALPDYAYLGDLAGSDAVPNARDFAARSLTVSNSPWLDETRFERIVEVLRASALDTGIAAAE